MKTPVSSFRKNKKQCVNKMLGKTIVCKHAQSFDIVFHLKTLSASIVDIDTWWKDKETVST